MKHASQISKKPAVILPWDQFVRIKLGGGSTSHLKNYRRQPVTMLPIPTPTPLASSTTLSITPSVTSVVTTITPAQSTPNPLTCTFIETDLVFVLDASMTISDAEFTADLNFAANVVASLPIGPNNIR